MCRKDQEYCINKLTYLNGSGKLGFKECVGHTVTAKSLELLRDELNNV